LRSLRARGLGGVRLVISDQHLGLKAAVEAVMVGSAWQRCRVHFMRNVLTRVKRNNTHMVIAAIQTIFAQPDARAVREQFERIVATLDDQFPDVATMLTDDHQRARDRPHLPVLGLTPFPVTHRIDAPTITSDRGSLLHHSAGRHHQFKGTFSVFQASNAHLETSDLGAEAS